MFALQHDGRAACRRVTCMAEDEMLDYAPLPAVSAGGDEPSSSESTSLCCSQCGLLLMRMRRRQFLRDRAHTPVACVVVCSECGTKNHWDG